MNDLNPLLVTQIGLLSSLDDINLAYNLLNSRRSQLIARESTKFYVGQTVGFEARGQNWIGAVEKVNTKSIMVSCTSPTKMKWRVSSGMLKILSS